MVENLLSYLLDRWIKEINVKGNIDENFKREIAVELTKKSKDVDLEKVRNYYDELRKGIKSFYRICKVFKMKSVYRATFGRNEVFGQVPFEVGLSFNWIFNVPVIYGSEIKGAVRHVYKLKYGNDSIFDTDRVGFTDAMPISFTNYILYPDVLTPHYANARNEANVNPVPIVHLVVDEGVTFEFIFYTDSDNQKLIDAIKEAMQLGIGAKTSVGYSFFTSQGEEEC